MLINQVPKGLQQTGLGQEWWRRPQHGSQSSLSPEADGGPSNNSKLTANVHPPLYVDLRDVQYGFSIPYVHLSFSS